MARTTITLPNPLHHQLAIRAQHEGKGLSQIIRELLRRALQTEEGSTLQQEYDAFRQLEGIGGDSLTNASQNIDHLLYGPEGAWRGEGE